MKRAVKLWIEKAKQIFGPKQRMRDVMNCKTYIVKWLEGDEMMSLAFPTRSWARSAKKKRAGARIIRITIEDGYITDEREVW